MSTTYNTRQLTRYDIDYIHVDENSRIPKYKQIMNSIKRTICEGGLSIGDRVPSINVVSERYELSRDTVEKAYRLLKEKKIIVSVAGKGYYITKTEFNSKSNVLVLINKLSAYKMRIFNSFQTALGNDAVIDLHIYHCEPSVFCALLNKYKGDYDHYVIMPHFKNDKMQHIHSTPEVLAAIQSIPSEKLILVDGNLKAIYREVGRVYQDFVQDIYNALSAGKDKLCKYKKAILVYPSKAIYPYPTGIVIGFRKFCIENQMDFEILDKIYDDMELREKDLYVIIEETDLVNLVKQSRDRHFKFGEDIGIISYNDTPLKELLGISVVSTNFLKMGKAAANMIMNKKNYTVKNEFNLINRFSL